MTSLRYDVHLAVSVFLSVFLMVSSFSLAVTSSTESGLLSGQQTEQQKEEQQPQQQQLQEQQQQQQQQFYPYEMQSSLIVNQLAILHMIGQMTPDGPAPAWSEELEGKLSRVLTELNKTQSTIKDAVRDEASVILNQVKVVATELQHHQPDSNSSTPLHQQLTDIHASLSDIHASLQQQQDNSTSLLQQQIKDTEASIERQQADGISSLKLQLNELKASLQQQVNLTAALQRSLEPDHLRRLLLITTTTEDSQELTTGISTITQQEETTTGPCVTAPPPLSGPEMAAKLKVGSRVTRGKDWKWDNQDGGPGGLGTIEEFRESGWISVKWDSSGSNVYRMGLTKKYDLSLVEEVDPSVKICDE